MNAPAGGGDHPVFTIGHSTRTFDELIGVLQQHGITMLVDVRSRPHNPFLPQFNRDRMKMGLLDRGVVYTYLGDRLGRQPGGTPIAHRPSFDFMKIETSGAFQAGVEWLCTEARNSRLCLFCGEAEPGPCHRSFLIGQNLVKRGFRVLHILPDGKLEEATPDLFHLPGGTDGNNPAC
ncbi:MAG: DUF488 domain-containing protein [Candidatus Wallbacteria bacterium]|nr:DUF488 domain-containing protein [Candidatus Wallbacteria bacterium]